MKNEIRNSEIIWEAATIYAALQRGQQPGEILYLMKMQTIEVRQLVESVYKGLLRDLPDEHK